MSEAKKKPQHLDEMPPEFNENSKAEVHLQLIKEEDSKSEHLKDKEEIIGLKGQKAKLEAEIQKLEYEFNTFKNKIEVDKKEYFKKAKADIDKKIWQCKKDLDGLDKEKSHLTREIDGIKNEKNNFLENLVNTKKDYNEILAEKVNLKDELINIKYEFDVLSGKHKYKKALVDQLTQEFDDNYDKIITLKEKVTKLEKEKDHAQRNHHSLSFRKARVENNYQNLISEIESKSQQHSGLKSEITKLEKEKNLLEKNVHKISAEFRSLEDNRNAISEELNSLKANLAHSKDEHLIISNEVSALETKKENTEEEYKRLERINIRLNDQQIEFEEKTRLAKEEYLVQKTKKEELLAQNKAFNEEINGLDQKKGRLESEIESLHSNIDTKTNSLSELEINHQKLEKNLTEMTIKLESITEELRSKEYTVQSLNNEKEELEANIAASREKAISLTQDILKNETKLSTLLLSIKEDTTTYEKLIENINELKLERKTISREINLKRRSQGKAESSFKTKLHKKKLELAAVHERLQELDSQLYKKRYSNKKYDKELTQRELDLDKINQKLDHQNAQSLALESKIEQKNHHIAALEKDIADLTNHFNQSKREFQEKLDETERNEIARLESWSQEQEEKCQQKSEQMIKSAETQALLITKNAKEKAASLVDKAHKRILTMQKTEIDKLVKRKDEQDMAQLKKYERMTKDLYTFMKIRSVSEEFLEDFEAYTEEKKSALAPIKNYFLSSEKRTRQFWYASFAAMGLILCLSITHFIAPKVIPSAYNGMLSALRGENINDIKLEQMRAQRAAKLFAPKQTTQYKSTFLDNIIYTSNFSNYWLSAPYQSEYASELRDFLLFSIKIDDLMTIKILNAEVNFIKNVVKETATLNKDRAEEKIATLRSAETTHNEELIKFLGSVENFNAYQKFKKLHFLNYKDKFQN